MTTTTAAARDPAPDRSAPGGSADTVKGAASTTRAAGAQPPPGRASEPSPAAASPEMPPRLSPLDALAIAKSRVPSVPDGASTDGYTELEAELATQTGTHWCFMNPAGEPTFTLGLLADLARLQRRLGSLVMGEAGAGERPVRYSVLASRTPGIFSLGTSRSFLASAVRSGDGTSLRDYARACVDVLHTSAVGFGAPLVTIALVEGDALGFGFEAALSCDVVVAERNARFGFPEIGFNLFPGMGAYSFLARRIGGFRAEEMILGGHTYSAEELHALGLVQVLAEPGEGGAAVEAFVERSQRRHNAQSAVFRVGREVDPVSRQELLSIAELWVEAALAMSESDLRRMEADAVPHQHAAPAGAAAAG